MRKSLKILHTLASCGLLGGLLCYAIVLLAVKPETAAGYADLRAAIAAISDYLLLPSLAVALITGLFAMAVHKPFMDKGWVWGKAAMGLLMFKGTLAIIGANADSAAAVSAKIAAGEAPPEALEAALANEWYALGVIVFLSVANVVLGVWRPRQMWPSRSRAPGMPAE